MASNSLLKNTKQQTLQIAIKNAAFNYITLRVGNPQIQKKQQLVLH